MRNPTRCFLVFVFALCVSVAISAAPVLVYDVPLVVASKVSTYWWALSALGLAFVAPISGAYGVMLGLPVAVVLFEGLEGFGNLGPIAAAITMITSGVPAAVGAGLGALARRLADDGLELTGRDPLGRRPIGGVAIVVPLAALGLAFWSADQEIEAIAVRQEQARAKVEAIWHAQQAHRRRTGEFACDYGDLDVTFTGRVTKHAVSSTAHEGDYWFEMRCQEEKTVIPTGFDVYASPELYEGTFAQKPGRTFCVDAGGELRTLPSDAEGGCRTAGEVVARLGEEGRSGNR